MGCLWKEPKARKEVIQGGTNVEKKQKDKDNIIK